MREKMIAANVSRGLFEGTEFYKVIYVLLSREGNNLPLLMAIADNLDPSAAPAQDAAVLETIAPDLYLRLHVRLKEIRSSAQAWSDLISYLIALHDALAVTDEALSGNKDRWPPDQMCPDRATLIQILS
jgi:hypothetical protein